MLRRILQVRFLILLIVVFTIINAIVFILLGIFISVDGIIGLLQGQMHTEEHPGLKILESLDIFLVALVFLIFAFGIAKLFISDGNEKPGIKIPAWLDVHNFTELKLLLWEAVLTTLVVFFVSDVVKSEGHYSWELFIIPGSIIMLSLSIFILRKH